MSVLASISKSWIERIESSRKHKEEKFDCFARDAMSVYDGPVNILFNREKLQKAWDFVGTGNVMVPRFQVSINKVFELVTLYLPTLMHRNPVRTVTPNRPLQPDSMRQFMAMLGQVPPDMDVQKAATADTKAWLQHWVLNRTPYELNLKLNSRYALTEALVKGRGLLWTEMRRLGDRLVPGSFFDSVDHLFIDPDCEWLASGGWVARRRCRPVREVEDMFDLARGTIKGNKESLPNKHHYDQLAETDMGRWTDRHSDLLEYYEVYSRIGMGAKQFGDTNSLSETLEGYGRNVYLAVAKNVEFPLNLPPDTPPLLEEVRRRVRWPIPVYDDPSHPWPFANCDFAIKPREVWPVAWIKPAMGLQKMLAWLYSFLASHVQVSTRQLLVVPKDIEEDVEDVILSGTDFELLKVQQDHKGTFENVIDFVKHPEVNGDLTLAMSAIERAFERCTGITELMHGYVGPTQMRSAEEAAIREQHTMLRPDDMADTAEDFMSLAARNEALAWRALASERDVAPLFGERFDDSDPLNVIIGPYTSLWQSLLMGEPLETILHEFEYRIEAGSARKPNRVKERQDVDESAQVILGPLFEDYRAWGDPTQLNAWFRKWCESRDFDPGLLQFPDRRREIMAQMMQQQMAQSGGPPPQGPPPEGGTAPPQGGELPPGEVQPMMAEQPPTIAV
jgi:hypothetical protein